MPDNSSYQHVKNRSVLFAVCCGLCVVLAVSAQAQVRSLGTVSVIGKRVVKLPAARKGEVQDSSMYVLPADTISFGERMQNLQIVGTPIPKYKEQPNDPLDIRYELSMGSFISPQGMLSAEYRKETFTLAGVVAFDYTAGHETGAKASTLLIGAGGTTRIESTMPLIGNFNLNGNAQFVGDGYTLYGNTAAQPDRMRSATRVSFGLTSLPEQSYGCDFNLGIAATSVSDELAGSTTSASAMTTGIGFGVRNRWDSLNASVRLDFSTTSLNYPIVTRTPSLMLLAGNLDWHIASKLSLKLGVLYGTAQYSDSGSTSLLAPRAALHFDVAPSLSIFAMFTPELRNASYRARIMEAAYVDPAMTLRAERVPINAVGGVRIVAEHFALQAAGFYETGENTAVVIGDTGTALGVLRYAHIPETRSLGARASLTLLLGTRLVLTGDGEFRSSVPTGSAAGTTALQLPMVPMITLNGRLDYGITDHLNLYAGTQFLSDRRTTLSDAPVLDLSSSIALNAGGSYDITDGISITAGITNLLSSVTHRWQNYTAPALEIRAGVKGVF